MNTEHTNQSCQAEPVNQQLLALVKSFGHKVGCAKNAFGEQCTCGVGEAIATAERAPRWPQVDMGFGKFAVGGCTCTETGVPGLLYLRLDEQRPHNADCSDVFPVGSTAPEDRIASVIHFHSARALQQTIDELLQMQREHYPTSEQAQQAEPVACKHSPSGQHSQHFDDGDMCAHCNQSMYTIDLMKKYRNAVARDVLMAAMNDVRRAQLKIVREGLQGGRWIEDIDDAVSGIDLDAIADRYAAQPPAVAVPDGVARAVEAVAAAIYFADSSDYLSTLWDTLRFLSPEIAAIAESDTRAAWERAEQDRAMLAAAPQAATEGCGACGDGCPGQGCRLERESPPTCQTCNGHGMIGGPSYRQPDEGGEPCPDCAAPNEQHDEPGPIIRQFGYQPLFNAISSATQWRDGRTIEISVLAFQKALLEAAPKDRRQAFEEYHLGKPFTAAQKGDAA